MAHAVATSTGAGRRAVPKTTAQTLACKRYFRRYGSVSFGQSWYAGLTRTPPFRANSPVQTDGLHTASAQRDAAHAAEVAGTASLRAAVVLPDQGEAGLCSLRFEDGLAISPADFRCYQRIAAERRPVARAKTRLMAKAIRQRSIVR